MATGQIVTRHYAGDGGLADRIYGRLRSLGFEERNPLSPRDTAAVDQFHVGGFEATEKLAQLLCPPQGSYVLDVGSGLGGPSRYLAAKYGCRVVGIDITENIAVLPPNWQNTWDCRILSNIEWGTLATCRFRTNHSM